VTDETDPEASAEPMGLRQGDLGLLERGRTTSARFEESARFAYIARDGTPRVLATWFHWTGEVLATATFPAAPNVRHAAERLLARAV
jgi:hypothetical protein